MLKTSRYCCKDVTATKHRFESRWGHQATIRSARRRSLSISESLEDLHPFFQHFRMSVTDADGEVVVADAAQLPEALAQLGHGGRERQYPDEIRSADLVLFRPQDHEVAAVVGEIARIRRLILLVDLPVTLGQVRQLRRHAASHVAKLL